MRDEIKKLDSLRKEELINIVKAYRLEVKEMANKINFLIRSGRGR